MIGRESRNEKRAAVGRSKPKARAAVIVTPERETPGCSARACATPSHQPWATVRSSSVRRLAAARSTTTSTTPKTASMMAINHG
jgi:hypothetical protein